MEFVPTGSALGVEVRGIDIRDKLPRAAAAEIVAHWHEHLVVIVRRQPMTIEQHLEFTKNFGEPEYSGANLFKKNFTTEKLGNLDGKTPPQIAVISNIEVDGKPIGSLGSGEAIWHTDTSFVEVPPAGSFLHALEIPPAGGATYFLNMYEALRTMPDRLRRKIEGLQILHPATHNSDGRAHKGFENVDDLTRVPGTRHPIIRTHPDTGRQALYLGRRLYASIVGMPLPESEALLDEIWAHTTQDKFVYRHDWQLGDLVGWDNRCAMHRRDAFDPAARRLMHRTQTRGTKPQ